MIKLSLAQCIQATNNGVFRTQDLHLKEPLSLEEMAFLSEYFRVTPLSTIDLSLVINKENSFGLAELGQVIRQNSQLKTFTCEVSEVLFDYKYKNDPELSLLGFIDDYRLKKINNRIYEAVVEMVENKPNLRQLSVILQQLETPASKSQAKQFSRNIALSPLKDIDIDFAVKKGAKLPLLNTSQPNITLRQLNLIHCTFGADALSYLINTRNLQRLIISDLFLTRSDLEQLDIILKSNTALKVFILNKTNLGQISSNLILERLKLCPNIKVLALSENNLSRFNIDSLCEYLSDDACSVTELDLSKNTYMPAEMNKITEALLSNTRLVKLIIDDNLIEDEGLQVVIQLLKSNHLITSVSMSHNCRVKVSDETINELCTVLRDPACALKELHFNQKTSIKQLGMLADAILANTSLETVSLDYKYPGPLGLLYKMWIDKHVQGQTDIDSDTAYFLDMVDRETDLKDSEESLVSSDYSFFTPKDTDEPITRENSNQVSMQL